MTSSANPDALAWLAATSVAVLLLIAVLAEWARQRPTVRAGVAAGAACALLGGALVLLLVAPADIPTGWITVLQEGRSARNVRQLYGLAVHAGGGFFALIDWLTGFGPTALPSMVRASLCLAVVNVILFFFVARHVLRSWWASLAFAAAYACNPNTVQAAFSETPAMLWTTHVWLACIVAAVVADRESSLRLRWLALACFGVLAMLSTWIRPEAALLAAPALAIGVVHVVGAESTAERWLRSAGRRLHAIVTAPLPVFVVVAVGLLALEYVPVPGDWRYAAAGLRPLNLSFLTWVQALWLLFPFAVVVLFVLGIVHGIRRWLAFFLLPVSLLVLLKVYAAGSHGAFLDKFRYVTFVTPFVLFLALFGFRELSLWAERLAWPRWWKRVAVLLLVATFPAWNPWPRELFGRRQQLPGIETRPTFLARNQQTEVRYLLDLTARFPRCVLIAKTPLADSTFDAKTGHRWLAFGATVPRPVEYEDPHGTGSVDTIAAQLAPDAPCVLFYRSLDCDLVGYAGCDAETSGRAPLEERTLENLPYSEIYEYGAHRGEIRLGVYPVVVRDRSALGGEAAR